MDEGTEPWGVKVERVEVKDVRVPEQLQRAMAAEAEAARNARAKVIAAEGEHKASRYRGWRDVRTFGAHMMIDDKQKSYTKEYKL